LGIFSHNLQIKDYPVRNFPRHRQEILDDLIALRDRLKPDLVLLPSTHDIHQDHQVLSQEGLRAFKHSTILGYEMPWNNLQFIAPAIFTLQDEQIEAKIEASLQYKSQEHRNYIGREFITSLARVRGQQANTRFGEAFQVVRWIV
jgi:LmbE family N-acetylglucosaminyl deacetylase